MLRVLPQLQTPRTCPDARPRDGRRAETMGTEGDFHRKQGSQACPTGRSAGRWVLGRDRGENGLNPSRPGIKTSKNRQLTGTGWKGGSQAVTCTREGPKVTQGHFPLPLRFLLPLGALSSLLPDKSGSPFIGSDTTTSRKPSRTHLLVFPYGVRAALCTPTRLSRLITDHEARVLRACPWASHLGASLHPALAPGSRVRFSPSHTARPRRQGAAQIRPVRRAERPPTSSCPTLHRLQEGVSHADAMRLV